jgi:hypothetical protein
MRKEVGGLAWNVALATRISRRGATPGIQRAILYKVAGGVAPLRKRVSARARVKVRNRERV